MNPITFVKEITTLSAATALLKVSTLANNLAVKEIKEAKKLLEASDTFEGDKRAMKHLDLGMAHAKNGRLIRNAALAIVAPVK